METIIFFEKKINLTPSEFNQVKLSSIDALLTKKAQQVVENKCSEQGFILPGSVKLISRSMGYFESARFTGDAIYYLKLEATVIYPIDGIKIIGNVIRKNKMGIYIDYKNAIRIQVPRDLHLGNEEYDAVQIGDTVTIELKRSKFAINDTYILASGVYHETNNSVSKESEGEVIMDVAEAKEEEAEEVTNEVTEVEPEVKGEVEAEEAEESEDESENESEDED